MKSFFVNPEFPRARAGSIGNVRIAADTSAFDTIVNGFSKSAVFINCCTFAWMKRHTFSDSCFLNTAHFNRIDKFIAANNSLGWIRSVNHSIR